MVRALRPARIVGHDAQHQHAEIRTAAHSPIDFLGTSELIIDSASLFGTGVGGSSYAGPLIENLVAGTGAIQSTGRANRHNIFRGRVAHGRERFHTIRLQREVLSESRMRVIRTSGSHTEGQRQTQAAGHLNLAGSSCMTAAMLVLEPIFEADLPPELYAYRPGETPNRRWSRWKNCCFAIFVVTAFVALRDNREAFGASVEQIASWAWAVIVRRITGGTLVRWRCQGKWRGFGGTQRGLVASGGRHTLVSQRARTAMQDWDVFYQRGGGSDEFRSRACPTEEAALIQARSLERLNYVLRIVKPDGGVIDRSTILDWIKNNPA